MLREMKSTLKLIEEDLEKQRQLRNKPLVSTDESEEVPVVRTCGA